MNLFMVQASPHFSLLQQVTLTSLQLQISANVTLRWISSFPPTIKGVATGLIETEVVEINLPKLILAAVSLGTLTTMDVRDVKFAMELIIFLLSASSVIIIASIHLRISHIKHQFP